VAAPSEVVKFLFTDVEGSTRRWEADAEITGRPFKFGPEPDHAVVYD
jgi:hypothetical protein